MPLLRDLERLTKRLLAVKRFVLLIGDSGAMIAKLSGSHVEWHHYLTGTLADNIAQAEQTLAEFPTLPIIILFDILGQSYRRERIPPVNLLDRPKIVARKLETLFPGTEFKGGLKLGPAQGDRAGYEYLFAAVAKSPEITAWQKLLDHVPNPVSDARLLPVESVKLLQRLSGVSADKEAEKDKWRVLISQHRTGGFRQIVTRDHRLAIARMSPGFSDIGTADDIATLLNHELGATLDYITRLGFERANGLEAVFIGRADIGAALIKSQLPVRHLTAYSPEEAEAITGLSGTNDDSGHYADLLHAAWGGSRLLPALSVWPPERRRRRMQALAQQWATLALGAGCLAGIVYGANLMWQTMAAETAYAGAEAARAQVQQAYDTRLGHLDAGPVPMARIRDILALHDLLDSAEVDLGGLLSALNSVISENIRLRAYAIEINHAAPELPPAEEAGELDSPAPAPEAIEGKIALSLDLSSFSNAELAIAEAERLATALQGALPEMRAAIIRQPLHILPADTFSVKTGQDMLAFTGDERLAEIEITGRLR